MRSLSGGYNSAAIAGATGVQDETGGYVHAGDNVIVSTTPVSSPSVGNKKEIAPEPEEKDYSEIKEDFSIHSVNAELIKKCLEKHRGRRKAAAAELGISERTLYRKIKELHLDK
jgi:DNA-binding NtrC family response regulator